MPTMSYQPGLRNAPSYLVSGHPFLTGTALAAGQEFKVEFPFVTKKVLVMASGSQPTIRVSFSTLAAGAGTVNNDKHYLELTGQDEAVEFDVKCKDIYISSTKASGGFQLYASLTNISRDSMYDLTGSGIATDFGG